jgi:hypothetical protein
MAIRYDQESLWELLRYAVGLEHPALREAPMKLVVKELPSQGPTVLGLIVAEPDEDIDGIALTLNK